MYMYILQTRGIHISSHTGIHKNNQIHRKLQRHDMNGIMCSLSVQ